VNLPDEEIAVLYGPNGEPLAYTCQRCFAMGAGGPPHGWNNPCPQQLEADAAYIAKLDSERQYYDRAGFGANDMSSAMRQMGAFFQQETREDE